MSDKPRKKVREEIRKEKANVDTKAIATDLKVDERKSVHQVEKNRYQIIVEERKKEKRARDEAKLKKPYIGNKKHIMKRAKAETMGEGEIVTEDIKKNIDASNTEEVEGEEILDEDFEYEGEEKPKK
jgi:hypothetical protein